MRRCTVAYCALHCLICKTLTANGGFSSQAGSRWQRSSGVSSELITEETRLSRSDSRPFWKLHFLHESSQDVSWYSGGQSVTGGQTSYHAWVCKVKALTSCWELICASEGHFLMMKSSVSSGSKSTVKMSKPFFWQLTCWLKPYTPLFWHFLKAVTSKLHFLFLDSFFFHLHVLNFTFEHFELFLPVCFNGISSYSFFSISVSPHFMHHFSV